ncbi:delta-9 desaturase [Gongronella butleri]|nr:delta-9 desaturase [Gongronella butleri]
MPIVPIVTDEKAKDPLFQKYTGYQDDEYVYAYTKSEARKKPLPVSEMPPLFDEPTTWKNFYKHIHWPRSIILVTTPFLAVYGAYKTPLKGKTLAFAMFYYFFTTLSVTAGYHRLWSHKSYSAHRFTQAFFALGGAGAFQGSIRWWARGHRAHHRYIDTDKDPYSASRGLFFAHFGWMLLKRPLNRVGKADVSDLKNDWLVQFQHKYYWLVALVMGVAVPTAVPGLWGDYMGGLVYAGVVRLVLAHHAMFCVNSLAHYMGETPYDDVHTPKDHWITAIATCGEGYHNYHHEFPQDYRNGILWYHFDPSKWLIELCATVGLTTNLKTFPANEVLKGKIQMEEKRLFEKKQYVDYGTAVDQLPLYTWDQFQEQVREHGKQWLLIQGIVYDVANFDHPGGPSILAHGIGKDMSTAFNGGVYDHSNGARRMLTSMRVGVLRNGMFLMRDHPDEPSYDTNVAAEAQ